MKRQTNYLYFLLTVLIVLTQQQPIQAAAIKTDGYSLKIHNQEFPVHSQVIINVHRQHQEIIPSLFTTPFNPFHKKPANPKKSLADLRIEEMMLHGAQKVEIYCPDTKHTITAYFYDHGSDTLMVCGAGLFKDAASIGIVGQIFTQYNVLIIEQDWGVVWNLLLKTLGWKSQEQFINKIKDFAQRLNPFSRSSTSGQDTAVNFDLVDESSMLKKEDVHNEIQQLITIHIQEMNAILRWAEQRQVESTSAAYSTIVGNFICYSSWIGIAYQHYCETHNEEPRFDKLILSSCGESFNTFINSIIKDPENIEISPDASYASLLRNLLKTASGKKAIAKLIHAGRNVIPEFSITNFVKGIPNTPMLFMHGTGDNLISLEDFYTLYNAATTINKNHIASLNPECHAECLYNLYWYYAQVTQFIESKTPQDFVHSFIQQK